MGTDSNDRPGVLPDAVEERGEELAPLVGVGLELPEGAEVPQELGGLVERWVGGRSKTLELIFERLALEDLRGRDRVPRGLRPLGGAG